MKIIFINIVVIIFLIISSPKSFYSQTIPSNISFYYVSGTGDHGIYLAKRNSSGNWLRGSKVLLDGKFDGNAVDPEVIKLSDGTYRLYYFKGYFVTPPPIVYTKHEIFAASSKDGISFKIEGKVYEDDAITDPTIVQLTDGSFLIAFAKNVNNNLNIVFAKSVDGLSFTSTGVILNNGGIPELQMLPNGSVRVLYNNPGGIASKISLNNGSTWENESGFRLATKDFVADPSVIRISANKWFMFVKSFNKTGAQNPAGHNVWAAESDDGNTFNLINSVVLDSASVPEGIVLDDPQTNLADEKPIVDKITLSQNFPNPFNPSTMIKYQIAEGGNASIKIFDLLGREIAVLIDEFHQPGIYNVRLSPKNYKVGSGVYFYELTSGKYKQTKKLVVIK